MNETQMGELEQAGEKDTIWIEDLGANGNEYGDIGDRIATALDCLCGLKDVRCLYIKKVGRHLEVGKAEVSCIE